MPAISIVTPWRDHPELIPDYENAVRVAASTGVGGAAILAGTAGYAAGNAIGQINVGGQSIHDYIADGIGWFLVKTGLW